MIPLDDGKIIIVINKNTTQLTYKYTLVDSIPKKINILSITSLKPKINILNTTNFNIVEFARLLKTALFFTKSI
jgi:hypothetical protein